MLTSLLPLGIMLVLIIVPGIPGIIMVLVSRLREQRETDLAADAQETETDLEISRLVDGHWIPVTDDDWTLSPAMRSYCASTPQESDLSPADYFAAIDVPDYRTNPSIVDVWDD